MANVRSADNSAEQNASLHTIARNKHRKWVLIEVLCILFIIILFVIIYWSC